MSKISNYVKKHKIFTAFLCLVLLLVLVWSGGRIYKIYHPNQAYYGTDFIYNSVAYDNMDPKWELIQNPTKRLCKVYETPHSLIPVGTLYGFENDKDHIIIQDNSIIFSPSTFMKIQDYDVFDINCIDKVVVEHVDSSGTPEKVIGHIEFKKSQEFSLWTSLIQNLKNGNYDESGDYGYRNDIYRIYFHIKEVPYARYWVADINWEDKIITVGHGASDPFYIIPKQIYEMIINGKEIPITEEPAQ